MSSVAWAPWVWKGGCAAGLVGVCVGVGGVCAEQMDLRGMV